jgi:hypothetical protein
MSDTPSQQDPEANPAEAHEPQAPPAVRTRFGRQAAPYMGVDNPQPGPSRRDIYPYLMGGIVAAVGVCLVLLVWLLVSPGGPLAGRTSAGATPTTPRVSGPVPTGGIPLDYPTIGAMLPAPVPSVGTGSPLPTSPNDPPRISMEDFKKLYDDPATRPLILDVRGPEAFEAGHIAGAVLFPEAEMAARVKDLPKDRLIVTYCQ